MEDTPKISFSRGVAIDSFHDLTLWPIDIRKWIQSSKELTGAAQLEIVDDSDYARLIKEALEARELIDLGNGNYYARSHPQDVARSETRTIVATGNLEDKGLYNNWMPISEILPRVMNLMKASMQGKKMYVIPYLMGPINCPVTQAGIELTNSRYVALHMILMTKAGKVALDQIRRNGDYTRGLHSTGDLEKIWRDIAKDKNNDNRYFVSIPDSNEIFSFGSEFGGNALLGKKFHSLRNASYKAREDEKKGFYWLAEHMLILEIEDIQTGQKKYVAGAFPSQSGKTNMAMMTPPEALRGNYKTRVISDDIAWLYVGKDKKLYAVNAENGLFGVAPGTDKETNPNAMATIQKNTIFTNVACNKITKEVWWESMANPKPADLNGWRDWKGKYIKDRTPEEMNEPWAQPNSRFTTKATNAVNISDKFSDPQGVPINAIFFGARMTAGEPLIRQLPDYKAGIYDALMMGAEATVAADDAIVGMLRPDPFAMRPFFSYNEMDYVEHWLKVMEQLGPNVPGFFHVNWFRKESKDWIWKGFGDNLRVILWALERAEGKGKAEKTSIGFIPTKDALNLTGYNYNLPALPKILKKDDAYARAEALRRINWLEKSKKPLPKELQPVHEQFIKDNANRTVPPNEMDFMDTKVE